jgi:hypothetical protein
MSEKERTLRVAETLCRELEWEGQTFENGDFVALLDGQVVAVANNPDDAISALRAIEPAPQLGMVVEVSLPVADVIR